MYKLTKDPAGTLIGVAGQRVYSEALRTGVQRHYEDLDFSGTINITVAATRVINRGSILGAWNNIGLNDGGEDPIKLDGRTLGFVTDLLLPSPRAVTRLGGVGVAATALKEMVRLSHIWPVPHAAIPQETVYVDRAGRSGGDKKLRLFGELRPEGGQGGIVQGGTSVMSVIPRFTIQDVYDDLTAAPPVLIPAVTQDVINVVAANAAYRYEYNLADYRALRAIIIQTDSDAGEVGDIIAALKLTVGGRNIIGPAQAAWDDLLRGMELDRGGAVYATGVAHGQSAYLAIVFQEGGRLANTLPPTLANSRFEFNWAPSVQAGATVSQVRLTFLGLQQVPGATKDNLPFVI